MRSTWISSMGSFLDRAEEELGGITKRQFNILTNSGTTALHLALVSLEIGADDEVIVPSFTFIASVNAITYVNARPIFVDIDVADYGMSFEEINKKITNKTKAIIYVHLYGVTRNLSELRIFCESRGIYLIEDVAECIGGSMQGKFAGTFGHLSIFSFYGNKIITSGEGGAISTNDNDLAQKIRILRNHGMSPHKKYYFEHIGYNYRMTNVAAAILLVQIKRFKKMFNRRNNLFSKYNLLFSKNSKYQVLKSSQDLVLSPWLYPVLCDSKKLRDAIVSDLRNLGIETRPFFIPIHTLEIYSSSKNIDLGNSIDIADRGFCLPTSSAFSRSQLRYLMKSVKNVVSRYEY